MAVRKYKSVSEAPTDLVKWFEALSVSDKVGVLKDLCVKLEQDSKYALVFSDDERIGIRNLVDYAWSCHDDDSEGLAALSRLLDKNFAKFSPAQRLAVKEEFDSYHFRKEFSSWFDSLTGYAKRDVLFIAEDNAAGIDSEKLRYIHFNCFEPRLGYGPAGFDEVALGSIKYLSTDLLRKVKSGFEKAFAEMPLDRRLARTLGLDVESHEKVVEVTEFNDANLGRFYLASCAGSYDGPDGGGPYADFYLADKDGRRIPAFFDAESKDAYFNRLETDFMEHVSYWKVIHDGDTYKLLIDMDRKSADVVKLTPGLVSDVLKGVGNYFDVLHSYKESCYMSKSMGYVGDKDLFALADAGFRMKDSRERQVKLWKDVQALPDASKRKLFDYVYSSRRLVSFDALKKASDARRKTKGVSM